MYIPRCELLIAKGTVAYMLEVIIMIATRVGGREGR